MSHLSRQQRTANESERRNFISSRVKYQQNLAQRTCHDKTIDPMFENDESNLIQPSFWQCDACEQIIKHGHFRFECVVCLDYNECERCWSNSERSHEHRLSREIAYGYVEEIETDRDDLATRIQCAIINYADRYCLGMRDKNDNDPNLFSDSYSWQTFRQIGRRIQDFSHGLRQLIEPGQYLGICAANRSEWLIADLASILQNFISVPIYRLSNDRDLIFILQNTPISLIVCDRELVKKFLELQSSCPTLKHIVSIEPMDEIVSDIKIHSMNDVERYGQQKQYPFAICNDDDCITIIYTSGSSGMPKGAMISAKALNNHISERSNLSFRNEPVKLCYRPLSWATDRLGSIAVFLRGGRIGFSTGNVDRLMEELALVRPTSFAAPPTIWNKIYSEYKIALESTDELVVQQQFARLIPNRCRWLIVGGALMSQPVFEFIRRCFSHCQIMESYGTTEVGSIAFDKTLEKKLDFRLESVPEMGYRLEDRPFPRGELLVKTSSMFSGYINNREETESSLTDDGFFRTGDIVEQINDEQIRIIDRKKNFFKLSQGQFVSPEFLEQIYSQSQFVKQIYIYGNLQEDSVFAVVVPHDRFLNDSQNLNDQILDDFRRLAVSETLRPHEIPSKIIVEFQAFTLENGFLTPSMKLCRYKLAAHYTDRFQTIETRLKKIIERMCGSSSITGDSLTAVRLSRVIQDDLGVTLPLNIFFQSNLTLKTLVELIENPLLVQSVTNASISKFLSDASFEFQVNVGQRKTMRTSPSAIFITGATGFVGAFLLVELLKTFPAHCQLVCLVRCHASTDPLNRIREQLAFFKLWKNEFLDRLLPVRGDLAEDYFGFDRQTYFDLAERIDLIYHCGAIVNFVLPYEEIRQVNVIGTRRILSFATATDRCTPIHFISTMSVDENRSQRLTTGYSQSKWLAEKLMKQAANFGLPVQIYRLGSIWADTENGASNPNDIHTLLFSAIIETKSYPTTASAVVFSGFPANLAAQKIVALSQVEANSNGQIHEIDSLENRFALNDILRAIERCGLKLRNLSFDQWRIQLKSNSFGDLFSTNPFEKLLTDNQSSSMDDEYLLKLIRFLINYVAQRK